MIKTKIGKFENMKIWNIKYKIWKIRISKYEKTKYENMKA